MAVGSFAIMSRFFLCTGIVALAMGGISTPQFAQAQPADSSSGLEGYTDQSFTDADGHEHRYRLLFPSGYGSWFAGAHANDQFAASVPICGGGDPGWAERYGKLPIWAFHGSEDRAVSVERSREMIAALRAAGHTPEPKYTEYAGGGHDVWTQTYQRDDLLEWLFSQRRANP